MISLLLAIIYVAFISLGLPDSLLGSAWSVMQFDFNVPISYAGAVSMIIAAGTIVSSLLSDTLTRKLGAGLVTALSVALTALALLGFSLAPAFWFLCVLAVPYGLGAGAVDAALNNYVALHYSSRHMSWLHCFWGVGASLSPYIMGFFLTKNANWHAGYLAVSLIQFVLTAILFATLGLWSANKKQNEEKADEEKADEEKTVQLSLAGAFKIKGVPFIMLAFFSYCAAESTTGLWASSYLVGARQIPAETAAFFASLFYLGITAGRFINGFVTDRLGDRTMIRIGTGTMAAGMIFILLPIDKEILPLAGLIIIGLGCAPVYPSIIHSTPRNFGAKNSQAIIGIQMASAYLGTTLMPPIFGLIAQYVSIRFYSLYLLIFVAILFIMTERVNKTAKGGE